MKKVLFSVLAVFVVISALVSGEVIKRGVSEPYISASADYIKWVDFSVPKALLDDALALDIETYGTENHIP